jgi:pimeloyl-ACP methyl ester carboxylesterase
MKRFLLRCLALVLGGALFFTVVGIAATWAPDQPVEALKPRLAPPPSQFIALQGMQVHLRDEGPRSDAVPIVLLHGTSASLHTWEGWVQALKDKRRVIRVDLPGFALTGPNPQNDYSTEAYVDFVRALVDQLGLKRFVLGGNSLGGQIAWSAAAAMPERVDRLILVDASGYPAELLSQKQSIPLAFRLAHMDAMQPLAQRTLPRGVVEASLRNVYGDPSKVTPELVDLYYALALREGNRAALHRRLHQGYTADVRQLKTLRQPTLILWGGRDRLTPMEFAQWFDRDIPDSRLVVFEDLGHVCHEEDPQRTVAEVKKFLGI